MIKVINIIFFVITIVCGQSLLEFTNIDSFYNSYTSKIESINKKEFETTDMYNNRLKNVSVYIKNQVFTFKVSKPELLAYNADLSVFFGNIQYSLYFFKRIQFLTREGISSARYKHIGIIPIFTISEKIESTVLTNALGATISGEDIHAIFYGIEFKGIGEGHSNIEISVPLDKAESFEENGVIIFQYRISNSDTVFQKYSYYSNATFDDPCSISYEYITLKGSILSAYAIDTLTQSSFPIVFKFDFIEAMKADEERNRALTEADEERNRALTETDEERNKRYGVLIGFTCGFVALLIGVLMFNSSQSIE